MIRRTFRSLSIRNYRLYFSGQLVSNVGTWCHNVALVWLVYELTGSGTAVGVVTALQYLPMLLGGLWGGVVADRFDRRTVLLVTQTSMALSAAVLAALVLGGVASLWEVYVLALANGAAWMVDMPTRHAFVTDMVGSAEVANAVGLNSAMFNASRLIGPALAGILIKVAGTGWCFAVNAVSFMAVVASLLAMERAQLLDRPPAPRARRQVREGLAYVWRTPVLRSILLLLAVVGVLGLNFQVVLAVMAKRVFAGGSGTYSLLTSAMALGSLVGALLTAGRSSPTRGWLLGSCLAFGAATVATGFASTLLVAVPVLVAVGATAIGFLSTANATMQLQAAPEMRGRVMAMYGLVFLGSTPLGGPVMGWVSEHLGASMALFVGGAATIAAGLTAGAFAWRAPARTSTPDVVPREAELEPEPA